MKVKLINELNLVSKIQKIKKVESPKANGKADRVEISQEAKKLAKAVGNILTPERLEHIKQRINDKFYEKDEVLKDVAQKILNSKEFQDVLRNYRLDKNV